MIGLLLRVLQRQHYVSVKAGNRGSGCPLGNSPRERPFAKALKWRPELSAIGTEVVEEGGTQVEVSFKYFTMICQVNY